MPAPKTYLRFALPPPLRTRTQKVLSAIERAPDPARHRDDLAALVVALTGAGMDYYFLKAVEDAKLGFVARQTASLGVAGALRVMSPIFGSVLGGADANQVRAISRHIRRLME